MTGFLRSRSSERASTWLRCTSTSLTSTRCWPNCLAVDRRPHCSGSSRRIWNVAPESWPPSWYVPRGPPGAGTRGRSLPSGSRRVPARCVEHEPASVGARVPRGSEADCEGVAGFRSWACWNQATQPRRSGFRSSIVWAGARPRPLPTLQALSRQLTTIPLLRKSVSL